MIPAEFTGGWVRAWMALGGAPPFGDMAVAADPDSAGPLQALRKPGGRLVRTGSVALTIVDERGAGGVFGAVAWRLTDGGSASLSSRRTR